MISCFPEPLFRMLSVMISFVSSCSLTAVPTAFATRDWFFGIIPGLNGSFHFPILTALYGWNSILIAM